jgi:hypothetical protein
MVLFDFTMFQSEHILIPFIFSLAIIFGTLETTKIFKNKAVNFLISVALAFFTVSNVVFLDFVWSQLGIISVFFILMFFVIFIMKAFGVSGSKEKSVDALIINGAILFVLLSVSYLYASSFPSVPFIGSGQNLLLLIFIAFMLVLFWLAYRSGGPEGH